MDSVCLGKCLPPGVQARRKLGDDDDLAKLQDENRDLRDLNQSLRRQLEELRNGVNRKSFIPGDDIVDPSQVKMRDDDDFQKNEPNFLDEEDAAELANAAKRTASSKQLLNNAGGVKVLIKSGISDGVARASALGKSRPAQVCIYGVAFAFVVFTLVASSPLAGLVEESHGSASSASGDHGSSHGSVSGSMGSISLADGTHGAPAHRRLGGGVSPLLKNIAFSLTSCGLIAFLVGICQQPLILGYLLGGILVGDNWGLNLVSGAESIEDISNLGLVFLLFMIGLELDVKELLKMGKVVLLTGALQFPICAGIQVGLCMGLSAVLPLGDGPYSAVYVGVVCGISSTMIVVKLLGERGDTDRPHGRLTIGILIFQDIWAMVFLAVQPNLASPDLVALGKTFGMIFLLIIIALSYAKFVMPAILYYASRSVELMLVLSLAWCFFMGVVANLPFIGIGMELAALIAGVALATFPYSAEFNGKIKYIRDFFITLFFAALGMKIPIPSIVPIATAVVISIIVLLFRWLGIFGLVYLFGGGTRLGALATINLSQISEFALVICSLGMKFDHIGADTLTIIIWTFMILAILSSNMIAHSHSIYRTQARLVNKMLGRPPAVDDDHEGGHDHDERDILFLGFHRIASMLVAEFETHNPELLTKLQVVDVNQSIKEALNKRGVKFSYGDISSQDVLEHAFHGEPKIVLSTIPDQILQGVSNKQILKVAHDVWPNARCIVTADNPIQAADLYAAGADYVLRSAKLCAERLHTLLSNYEKDKDTSGLLREFATYKQKDKDSRKSFVMAKV